MEIQLQEIAQQAREIDQTLILVKNGLVDIADALYMKTKLPPSRLEIAAMILAGVVSLDLSETNIDEEIQTAFVYADRLLILNCAKDL